MALLAQHLTGVSGRYAEIHEVLHAVADNGETGLGELWELEENQRLTRARLWVDVLTSKGPLRPALKNSTAVDVMWY